MDDLDKITITEEVKTQLREEQSKLIKVIEAFSKLAENKEWKVIQELVYQRSLAAIERQLMNESLSPELKPEKIYRLQGEWAWAKQYNETDKFIENLKRQLETIKRKLI